MIRAHLTRARVLVLTAFVLVIAALVAGSAVLFGQTRQAEADSAARDSAQEAGKTLVPKVLSYNYQTLQADIANATGAATGNFKQNLQALMTQVVQPTATNDNVVTKASVTHTAVVDGHGGDVVLLVLLSQESTSRNQPTPVVSTSSARVQLHRDGDRWLVADLQPL
ncbi:hypothetical protein [Amycolatopsis sp.]|uniref:hypothetical protein n=1 Tax=Amycolatopsis sp. TaxID=37632 RepID=UPI002CA26660|nr:hypothetical protein [Amycolatopsis sp.]HVV08210.1 hypothetical protein [Amycolatopsis sp.]